MRLAGLDPFQLDLWQHNRDAWWQTMRVTCSRMAKMRWKVGHLRLTVHGADLNPHRAVSAHVCHEIDAMARQLLPRAAAVMDAAAVTEAATEAAAGRGAGKAPRLRSAREAIDDFQCQIRV